MIFFLLKITRKKEKNIFYTLLKNNVLIEIQIKKFFFKF